MKRQGTILLALGTAMAGTVAGAADSARDRYNNDMTCHAVVATATAQHALPGAVSAEQAANLAAVYARRTAASARAAGISAAQAMTDTRQLQWSMVARMTSRDPATAARERAETATMTTNCAALLGAALMGQ